MTVNPDKAPEVLDRLWDDISPVDPPIADLLAVGHAATRRRRRTVLASAAAVVMVVGGGLLATGQLARSGEEPTVGDTGARDLSVRVHGGTSQAAAALFGGAYPNRDAATWDPTEQRLVYVSGFAYSSSCPPTATAELTDAGAVLLEIEQYDGAGVCTADATRYTVTVGGFAAAPTELKLQALGTPRVVGVQQAPGNAALFVLDCAQADRYVKTILDHFGMGQGSATPLQAVEPMLGDDESAVIGVADPIADSVSAALLRADGTTRAVVSVGQTNGWRADALDSCVGEGLKPARR